MALDVLPDEIITKDRIEWRDLWLRSFKLRVPAASIAQDTAPWIDATTFADQGQILSVNARIIGRSIPLSEVTGDRLDQRLVEVGLPPRFAETGSQGAVQISASTTGATIPADAELTDPDSGLRFKCTATATYADGASVPIAAIDTGTQTNLDPGTVLVWSDSIAGLFQSATVIEQTDGTGLSGGRAAESDDEVRLRISDAYANPASAGNTAYYIQLIENSLGHGVSVQKAFAIPAALGPGTIAWTFTLKPATPGSSRIPNASQLALVAAYVAGKVPGDDQSIPLLLIAQPVNIVLDVSWAAGAADWADAVRWPPRYATGAGAIKITAATSAVSFTLATDNALYSGVPSPVVGQSIGLYDATAGFFRRKRILSVTGSGPWVIAVDTTNGASDTTYTPVVGTRACPWSDSLQTLLAPILDYFGTLGPGEQQASFFDPGVQQRRNPVAPKFWPNTISNRLAADILTIDPVADAVVREGLGVTTTVGTVGIALHQIETGDVSAFPLT